MPADEYREFDLEVIRQLSRIEEKMDAIQRRLDDLLGKQRDLEKRVTDLERSTIRMATIASVIAACVGLVVPTLVKSFFGM